MAADKLNWNELRRAVMHRTDATEQEATTFLNALIEQIIEALKTDKQVRINGLGTFRLQSMQPRKSVNIATGEEIVIEGYNKLAFTPEASVKEMIANNPTPTDTPQPKVAKKKKDTENEELTPIQKLGQQADEIVDLLADLGQKPNTGSQDSTIDEPTDENLQPTEDPIPVEKSQQEEETETPATIEEKKLAEEPSVETTPDKEETPANTEEKAEEEPTHQPVADTKKEKEEKEESASENKEKKPKRKYHFWRDTLICVICLLIVLVCGYLFGRTALSNWVESLGTKNTPTDTAIVVESSTETAQIIQEETPIVTPVAEEQTEAAAVEPADTPTITEEELIDTEITYSTYLATEQINEGSRLTWLAYRYYGNKALWVYIYDANKDHLTDPNHIQVGTAIRIPKLTVLQQDTTNAQTKHTIERLKAAANAHIK